MKGTENPSISKSTTLSGSMYAFAAFLCWGTFPLYFKEVGSLTPLEILSHRIFWSFLLLCLMLTALKRWPAVVAVIHNRRLLRTLFLSAILISINWLVFIWAVGQDLVLQTSLGYFISPLVSILLGILALKEKLFWPQWVAVILAIGGVLFMSIGLGEIPWVSLILAVSFGLYGLVRKQTEVDSITGLFFETLFFVPFTLCFLVYLAYTGKGLFGSVSLGFDLLIMLSGVITSLPLILFAQAAKRLTLSAMGFFQYIVPTGHFLLAVFVFEETFTIFHLITFGLIWTGLIIYSVNSARGIRLRKIMP